MSHCEEIKQYLAEGGSLTPIDAQREKRLKVLDNLTMFSQELGMYS